MAENLWVTGVTPPWTGRGPPCTAGVLVGRILNHCDTTHQCHTSISESWEACPLNGIRIGSVSAPWNMVGPTYDYIIWWGVRWFGYLKSLCAKDLDINTQILNIYIYTYIHQICKCKKYIYIHTVYRLFIHHTYTYDFVNMLCIWRFPKMVVPNNHWFSY